MKPFVVDVFKADSKNNISKRRLQADTLDAAMHLMEVHRDSGDVTRVLVSQRVGSSHTRLDKKYVWMRGL